MSRTKISLWMVAAGVILASMACKAPAIVAPQPHAAIPASFPAKAVEDSSSIADTPWRNFFTDSNLVALIDIALKNNQELNIAVQEIEIARNEALLRKGAILPSVRAGFGTGLEKVGRYTSQGAGDASTEIKPGKEVPEVLPDFTPALYATWEVDIWKKLRNARKAAIHRFLASMEGKNLAQTSLVAEIASSYYELLALDGQLQIIRQNIEIQKNALEIVRAQKEAAKATELAVQKFQAEVLASSSMEFQILQQITETENRVNFLLGRFPQEIRRSKVDFLEQPSFNVQTGVPSGMLHKRPDIRQAEQELEAAKIDVKVARAEFFPSLEISASAGLQAFNPAYLFKLPESALAVIAGDLAGPIINRAAIKAEFNSANARQVQLLYEYERRVLNAYLEVAGSMARIRNLEKAYALKSQQVAALNQAISVSNDLFQSARADYLEVLMTQRDVLEAKLELLELKQQLLGAGVQVYRELGGGWQ